MKSRDTSIHATRLNYAWVQVAVELRNSFLSDRTPCTVKCPLSMLRNVLGGCSCSARTANQKARQWREEGRLQFVACQLPRAQILSSTTRLTCPPGFQPEHQISAVPKAAEPKIITLTLAAKLDVSQVIWDPRVPVHFGNKVRVERNTEKRWKISEYKGEREAAA